jgi:hypothetical protein
MTPHRLGYDARRSARDQEEPEPGRLDQRAVDALLEFLRGKLDSQALGRVNEILNAEYGAVDEEGPPNFAGRPTPPDQAGAAYRAEGKRVDAALDHLPPSLRAEAKAKWVRSQPAAVAGFASRFPDAARIAPTAA